MRRAQETNWPYRLVEESDLVAGKEIIMVDTGDRPGSNVRTFNSTVDPALIGTTIRLDDPPVKDEYLPGHPQLSGKYVYYHCVKPAWDQQCFVPLADFMGKTSDCTKYWVEIDQYLRDENLVGEQWRVQENSWGRSVTPLPQD